MRSSSACAWARRPALSPSAPAKPARTSPAARMIQGRLPRFPGAIAAVRRRRIAVLPAGMSCGPLSRREELVAVALPTASCTPGMSAAATSVASGTKSTTYPGWSTSSIRFGAGATRKSPRVPATAPQRGRRYTVKARRTLERRGHSRFTAQVDPGHGHRREAGDERRRQVRRARSGGEDAVLRVGGHDRLTNTLLVRRTL